MCAVVLGVRSRFHFPVSYFPFPIPLFRVTPGSEASTPVCSLVSRPHPGLSQAFLTGRRAPMWAGHEHGTRRWGPQHNPGLVPRPHPLTRRARGGHETSIIQALILRAPCGHVKQGRRAHAKQGYISAVGDSGSYFSWLCEATFHRI